MKFKAPKSWRVAIQKYLDGEDFSEFARELIRKKIEPHVGPLSIVRSRGKPRGKRKKK
jgi:hypothetical protein